VVQYHVGDVVTSMCKASLVPGRAEALVYSTISGAIGALLPFVSRADIEFFQLLELQMRNARDSISGRDHLAFRSNFIPSMGVVDGDLCELFYTLPHDKQVEVAKALSRSPEEVAKRIADARHRLM
jgi:splicing factor 3B subunit 3